MKLLKIKEVAQTLGLSYLTVYLRVKNGEIPSVKVGRSVRIKSTYLEEALGCEMEVGLEEHCLRNGLKMLDEDRALEIIRQYLQTRFAMFEEKDIFKHVIRR